jgi:hypothetical protein
MAIKARKEDFGSIPVDPFTYLTTMGYEELR